MRHMGCTILNIWNIMLHILCKSVDLLSNIICMFYDTGDKFCCQDIFPVDIYCTWSLCLRHNKINNPISLRSSDNLEDIAHKCVHV